MTATNSSASLFDTANGWNTSPLEAFAAWLLMPDFVTTKAGKTQALRESSAKIYGFMGSKFIREVVVGENGPHKPWKDIDSADIYAFLNSNQLKKEIRNRYVHLLERLFDHLKALDLVEGNPARGLAIKESAKDQLQNDKTVWLTEEQIKAVQDNLPSADGKWKAHRNRVLIATILGGGLRVAEVIRLTTQSVGQKQEDGSLHITVQPVGAGRVHRTRVSSFAATLLIDWLKTRDAYGLQGNLLFPAKTIGGFLHPATVYRQVASVMNAAGIDPMVIKRRGARTLRNTFALNELESGKEVELVGEYLGHHADRSTLFYKALLKQ